MVEIDTEEDEDPREHLPEGTKHVFYGSGGTPMRVEINNQSDEVLEFFGLTPEDREQAGVDDVILVDHGDEVPFSFVSAWEHVGDRFIATDGNMQTISSEGHTGLDKDRERETLDLNLSAKQMQ